MNERQSIEQELAAISPLLADLDKQAPLYSVPEGYFSSLSTRVQVRLTATHHKPALPNAYFDSLADQVLVRIAHSETSSLIPDGLTTPYQVDVAYFDKLPVSTLDRIKTVRMPTRSRVIWFRAVSVAAAVVGLVFLCISLFQQRSQLAKPFIDPQLATVLHEAQQILNKNTFESTVNELEDKDIIAFLGEHGHDVNTALLAAYPEDNLTDDAERAFLDDQTLEAVYKDLQIKIN
ncbi:MAG: hypothetical protein ACKO5C_03340 [Ferruginibacter sp.]